MTPNKKPSGKLTRLLTLLVLCLTIPTLLLAKAPFIDPTTDSSHLGPPEKFLFWTPEQQVASYRNINLIFPTRVITTGPYTLELPEQLRNLGRTCFDKIVIN